MKSAWNARIERALKLTSIYPFAAEVLRFYVQVASLQQELYFEFQQAPTHFFASDSSSFGQLNPDGLVPRFSQFLAAVRYFAPAGLAQAATALQREGSESRWRLIEETWLSPTVSTDEQDIHPDTVAERCLAWLFLQPCAEYLAGRQNGPHGDGSPTRCPLCGGRPIVGVLRPEGDGARKSLICMLCAHEWPFRRIYCPSCGEERETHMAFYSAPEIPHVRVDVCDTCQTYLKSVDLTKAGLAVPIVDELATLPLDLWAREQGYRKLQVNVVGI